MTYLKMPPHICSIFAAERVRDVDELVYRHFVQAVVIHNSSSACRLTRHYPTAGRLRLVVSVDTVAQIDRRV